MVTRRTLLKAGGVVGVPLAIGVGMQVFPIRPQLYDVRIDNRRSEATSVALRLAANGETAVRSTVKVPTDDLLHLSCEWPRAAWSYEMAVQPAAHDEWQTITWDSAEKLCKKIVINEENSSIGPVSFFDSSPCPTTLDEHSCG